ncbi:lipocalin family protein [Xanthocytophaga agilis]|uniref:Lipocalin family protein n=1 Tax=Xanthocytophaga agilis TaxID=3048010 RepID=A0AAE3R0B3_9BACT|nr:lipocalin family protein [Xanthocytophaga agilis]MDJ1501374.1 lipocalin family protein [Xanthocytophaga agilis]
MKTLVTNVRLTVLALTLLGSLAACKKHDPDPVKNNDPIFVGKHWKMSAITTNPIIDFDGDGTADPDLLPFFPTCVTDNIVTFKEGGKIESEEGEACPDETPITGTGTWSYNENTKIFTLTDGTAAGTQNYEIVEMSATTLKWKVEIEEEGQSLDMIMEWKAQ